MDFLSSHMLPSSGASILAISQPKRVQYDSNLARYFAALLSSPPTLRHHSEVQYLAPLSFDILYILHQLVSNKVLN